MPQALMAFVMLALALSGVAAQSGDAGRAFAIERAKALELPTLYVTPPGDCAGDEGKARSFGQELIQ